jgi:hypothetical protein
VSAASVAVGIEALQAHATNRIHAGRLASTFHYRVNSLTVSADLLTGIPLLQEHWAAWAFA